MKILYSKYSNERKKEFSIKTLITENESGIKEVIKYPAAKESRSHIEKLLSSRKKIDEFLGESGFKAAPCRKKGEGVSFDFIEGKTLEEYFEELCDSGRTEEVFDCIARLKEKLLKNSHVVRFEPCDNFRKIFGSGRTDRELHAAEFTCLDLIFGNIIIDGYGGNIIDYEWCFDFPIPIEYVIYRAVNTYIIINNRVSEFKDIFLKLDIDEGCISLFEDFERSFQKYVTGNASMLRNLYEKNGKDALTISYLLGENDKREIVRFYIYDGKDFCEAEDLCITYIDKLELETEIPLSENIKTLRLDPAEGRCVVKLKDVYASGEGLSYRPEIISNGYEREGVYFFPEEDPQIHFINLKEGTDLIHIECIISPLSASAGEETGRLAKAYHEEFIKSATLNHKLNLADIEIERLKSEKLSLEAELRDEIERLKAENSYKTQYISEIENSRSWKAIVKMRKLMGKG